MNLGNRNTHRTKKEAVDQLSEQSMMLSVDEAELQEEGPSNNQGLKNELWTRIIQVKDQYQSQVQFHSILADLKSINSNPPDPVKGQKKMWKLLFDSKACLVKFGQKSLEQMRLSETKILQIAEKISDLRETLRAQAVDLASLKSQAHFYDDESISKLAQRVSRSHYTVGFKRILNENTRIQKIVPPGLRRKRMCPTPLSVDQKLDICHRVIVECESHTSVAQDYKITRMVVQAVVKKMRQNPKHMAELIIKQSEGASQEESLCQFVISRMDQGIYPKSAKQIRDDFHSTSQIFLQLAQVNRVMQKQLRLRYRKIVRIAPQANSHEKIIQRQQCSLEFLKLYQSKRRIINIDETWLDSVKYNRRCWQPKDGGPGQKQIAISPRITMILGVDNLGEIFVSLLQANSDHEIMEIFLLQLVQMLDSEDKNWRRDTVIVWDNASYHTKQETLCMLQTLKVPILPLGGYSYHMAPAELVFARFKTSDLYSGEVKAGKKQVPLFSLTLFRNFDNIVFMATESIRKIPKAVIIMFWHHILLEAFNYITLKPI